MLLVQVRVDLVNMPVAMLTSKLAVLKLESELSLYYNFGRMKM